MSLLEGFKIIIFCLGCFGSVASIEMSNWLALTGFLALALTAIVFKDTKLENGGSQ